MDSLFKEVRLAFQTGSGPILGYTLVPMSPSNSPSRLRDFYYAANAVSAPELIRRELTRGSSMHLTSAEVKTWVDIYTALWHTAGGILSPDSSVTDKGGKWTRVYESYKEMTNHLIRGYSSTNFESWTLPCLYVAAKYLRAFAQQADDELRNQDTSFTNFEEIDGSEKNEKMEDCARIINRIFTLCISDRAPLELSRKWGTYYIMCILFKTYFKLNAIGLCKSLLRALDAASADMPPLEDFPKSQIVTFKYYVGVVFFLQEEYAKAEENLSQALKMCHKKAQRNMDYLIPCHLLTTHTLPTETLLAPYPRLKERFGPLCRCIKAGDLAGFDAALVAGEDDFVKRRIYLTLERGRDIALRNLFRKVFILGDENDKTLTSKPISDPRRTRVPVEEFRVALSLGAGTEISTEEVECLLANLIYKNLMKGYISRERGIVVLSGKNNAFPGTGV